ncbi:MAG: methyltransferase domain-containing protein [Theionarchaea archaeon]|nr:MAG: hypothetical protein AYK19_01330 [Theionarchaea archaeon DG-70-1]MBU7029808.1 methyltransferase domain-containing protein [Theionarchaea archaeon]
MKNSWYENDDFWETVAPLLFGEKRWAATAVEVDQILALLRVTAHASILDMCCGPGRHSLELARRHFCVTGVDRTVQYLETAREKAEREGLCVEFVQEDMRHFCRPETFDGALLVFTSFGYFEDPNENHQVLVNMYTSLKKGGRLVIELMGKEVVARIFRERDWGEQDGVIHLEERKINKDWSKIENRWIIIHDQIKKEFKFSHWIYSASELSALLKECGFLSVEVYGDLGGTPYDCTARRLVVVAQK